MRPVASNVLICASAEAAAAETAEQFVFTAARSIATRDEFNVAIPGGSSPRRAFELLAEPARASEVPWDRVCVFFTDERCVPPTHEESNYRLATELLLSKVPIPRDNVFRFAGELPPIEAAAQYEQIVRHKMGMRPRFDLVLLGMGEDGHTASLFPDSPALDDTEHIAVANFVPKLDSHRLTLTAPVFRAARNVIILALGAAKAASVREALQGRVDERRLPVQSIRPRDGRLLWIVDQQAASKL
mgnify:CR=1 FL=1